MKRFSSRFKSFNAWKKAMPRTSVYAKTIVKRHKSNTKATLSELRNFRVVSLDKIGWDSLDSESKVHRLMALEVKRKMLEGKSLKFSIENISKDNFKRDFGIIKRHLGKSLFKRKNRWKVKVFDTIQRGMHHYENGRIISVVVKNSRDASLIGQHQSAIKEALLSGDDSALKKFKKLTFKDVKGKKHRFETDLSKLFEIEERKETPEEYEIYATED